jgi:cytochrome c-type biogenesis protein CcmH
VSFRLDDTLAMMPARKLSDFNRVIVEARISRSGQATPAPGDLFTQSPVFTPAEGKELQLVISRVIS